VVDEVTINRALEGGRDHNVRVVDGLGRQRSAGDAAVGEKVVVEPVEVFGPQRREPVQADRGHEVVVDDPLVPFGGRWA